MRPLTLRMKNFGPFEDETVDFTKPKPMFLITGKTGSGKSMIFDAMTYALYGKYSGSRQKLKQASLRSDFAETGEESYVEFEFSVHDLGGSGRTSTYKVKRIVPYEYKTRTGSISTKAPEVELSKKDPESGEWLPMQFKTNEARTNAIAEDIIGLQFGEFNQIVLLPQGKFAEFLTESSSDREATLKKIFPIDEIESVVDTLKEKNKEYSAKIKEYANRIEEITKDGRTESYFTEREAEISAEMEKLESENRKAAEKRNMLSEAKANAQNRLEKAQESAETKMRISALESQKGEIEELERKVENSKKASLFKLDIDKCATARERLEKARSDFSSIKSSREESQKRLSELEEKAQEIAELSKKNEADTEKVKNLIDTLEKLEKLREANAKKEKAEAELEEFKKTTEENDRKIEEAESELSKTASAFGIAVVDGSDIAMALLQKFHEAGEKRKEAESLLSAVERIRDEEEKFRLMEKAKEEAEEKAAEEAKKLETAKNTLERLKKQQKEFEDNEKASALAKLLKPGCACPVCGSKEHPSPAKESGKDIGEEIELQEETVASFEKKSAAATETAIGLKKDVENQASLIENLKSSVEGGASVSEAEERLSKAQECERKLEEGYIRAKNTQDSLAKAKRTQQAQKDTLNTLGTELEKAKAVVEEQEKSIAEDKDADSSELKERIRGIEGELERNRSLVAKFGESLTKAREEDGRNSALESKTKEILKEAERESQTAEKNFNDKLSLSMFKSEDEVRSNMMQEKEAEDFEKKISSWKTELEKMKTLFESTKSAEGIDEIRKEIEEATSELDSLSEKERAAAERIKSLSGEKATIVNTLGELREKTERHKRLLEESEIYTSLYKDMNGETGPKNVFSSWILAMHFSEIVDYANERFLELSGGRYQFKIQKTKEVGKHGLDIAINDSENGDRAPETLSGGETFQASISLALAMTDVICQRTGGIRLDSLFIDEGFGSLDQESLDKAIATLKRIQEQKMVGVISHVEAMETEIKSHVVVDKGPDDCHSSVRIENFE